MKIKEIRNKELYKKLAFFMIPFLLGGCFDLDLDFSDITLSELENTVSLHPLYTDDTVVFEEKLLGKFCDGNSVIEFKKGKAENSYSLTFKEDDTTSVEFTAYLVEIEDALLIDLSPNLKIKDFNDFSAILLVQGHMFGRIDAIEPNFQMRFFEMGKISEDPKCFGLKHEKVGSRIIITASSKKLHAFLEKYGSNDDFFEEQADFKFIKLDDVNDSNKTVLHKADKRTGKK